MEVPSKNHYVWKALFKGDKSVELSFLDAQILLLRLLTNANKSNDQAVQKDIAAIIS